MSRKRLSLLFLAVFLICFFLLSGIPVTRSSDRTFIKFWEGNVESVVGNVKIVNDDKPSEVFFNDKIPDSGKIVVSNLPHGISLRITWTDWRGGQEEVVCVECTNGVQTLVNYIPYPPEPESKLER